MYTRKTSGADPVILETFIVDIEELGHKVICAHLRPREPNHGISMRVCISATEMKFENSPNVYSAKENAMFRVIG